jgi:N-acetylglucosamine kinase-like BadF-type ATPase
LRAIAQAADGLAPPTALRDAILAHWQLAAPQELIARIYRTPVPRAEIAALAPLVEQAAGRGDPVALRLVGEAGAALARILDAVARRLGFAHGQAVPCALGGGLLVQGRWVREDALRAAAALGWRLEPAACVEEPAAGALRLARGEVGAPGEGE